MNAQFECLQSLVQPRSCSKFGRGSDDVPCRIVVRGPETRLVAGRARVAQTPERKDMATMLQNSLRIKIHSQAGLHNGWVAAAASQAKLK
jgi:hypothetical protein